MRGSLSEGCHESRRRKVPPGPAEFLPSLTSRREKKTNKLPGIILESQVRVNLGMSSAEDYKAQGNAAFARKDYDIAIDLFSKGIALDENNHVLYSNRSASYAGIQVTSIKDI